MILGTAVFTVGYGLDVAAAAAAASWVAAPAAGKDAAYAVLSAVTALGRGTFPLGLVSYWPAFAILGIVQTLTGRESSFALFIVLLVLTTLWFLATGAWAVRRTRRSPMLESGAPLASP